MSLSSDDSSGSCEKDLQIFPSFLLNDIKLASVFIVLAMSFVSMTIFFFMY